MTNLTKIERDQSMPNPPVVRNFQYPGGRLWTLCVVQPDDDGPQVLRFAAGMRSFDLEDWPKDWAEQPDDVLASLLRRAAPRRHDALPPSGSPRRRWNDRQQSTPLNGPDTQL